MQRRFRMSTIKDVARMAGVSHTTVSHVVNKTRFVQNEVRERVLQAIDALNYKPNVSARSLKGKGTSTIGVIISDIRDTFYSDAVSHIESYANTKSYNVILCDAEASVEKEQEYIEILLHKGIDGLIIAPLEMNGSYDLLLQSGIPIVQVDRKVTGIPFPFVGIDNEASSERATKHLIEHGYRSIGFIGYEHRYYTMEKRLHGYQRAVRCATLPELAIVMSRAHGGEQASSQILDWIDKHAPEAILCGNDDICFEAYIAAERLRLRIPEDLALITFDDLRWFRFSSPPITAIRQPAAKIGEVAIRVLLNAVNGNRQSKPREVLLDTELVIRSSCGKHPQRRDEQRTAR